MNKLEMTENKYLDNLLERINNGEFENIKDEDKGSALLLATYQRNHSAIVELLKHPKTDVNIRDNKKNTSLTLASSYNLIETVKELLKHPNININLKNNKKNTALDCAIKNNYTEIISLIKTYSYTKENRELFEQLGIDSSVVETVISEDNCFETNKQNINSLIQQYRDNSVSVVNTDEL